MTRVRYTLGLGRKNRKARTDPRQEVCRACRMKERGPHRKGSSGITVFPHWVVSRNSELSIGPGVKPLKRRCGLREMVWGTGLGVFRSPTKL